MMLVLLFITQVMGLLTLYLVLKKKISQNMGMEIPRRELNSLIVAFNRNVEESITVMEKQMQEAELVMKQLKDEMDNTQKLRVVNTIQKNEYLGKPSKKNELKKTEIKKTNSNFVLKTYLEQAVVSENTKKDKVAIETELEPKQKLFEALKRNESLKKTAVELKLSVDEVKFLMMKYQLSV